MKIKINVVAKLVSLCVLTCGLSVQPAFADHGIVQHAANSCFPRVFAQIDQFKVSSGGLRNTNSNPRNIVCSINTTQEDGDPSYTGIRVFLGFEQLAPGQEMECTLYTRSSGNGSLLDSVTQVFTDADSGQNAFISGDNDWAESGLSRPRVSTYVQCAVPGNGRVFMTRAFLINEVI